MNYNIITDYELDRHLEYETDRKYDLPYFLEKFKIDVSLIAPSIQGMIKKTKGKNQKEIMKRLIISLKFQNRLRSPYKQCRDCCLIFPSEELYRLCCKGCQKIENDRIYIKYKKNYTSVFKEQVSPFSLDT